MKMRLCAAVAVTLLVSAAAAVVTACGSETTLEEAPDTGAPASTVKPDTGTVTPPPDAATPPPDSAAPPPADAGAPDAADAALPPTDAAPDARDASVDATIDAAPVDAGSVATSLKITTLAENCMPIVAKDPIRLVGTIDVVNTTASPVGPVTATGGEIRDLAGNLRTRFELLVPLSVGPVPAGQTRTANYEKRPASAVPALQCATLACNTDVVVSLSLSGPGVAGTTAKSGPVRVSCSF